MKSPLCPKNAAWLLGGVLIFLDVMSEKNFLLNMLISTVAAIILVAMGYVVYKEGPRILLHALSGLVEKYTGVNPLKKRHSEEVRDLKED